MSYCHLLRKLFALSVACVSGSIYAVAPQPSSPLSVPQEAISAAERMALDKGVPPAMLDQMRRGKPQSLIVEFDGAPVDLAAQRQQVAQGMKRDNPFIINFKMAQYADIKQRALSLLTSADYKTETDYSHLPLAYIRFNTRKALDTLLAQPEVLHVYPDRIVKPVLAQSLPLIRQSSAVTIGQTGQGATVAVIDTGVDFTNAAFGSCTSPGVPAGCRVVYSNNGSADGSGHGTAMAGIVAGVAPSAKIASYDVFRGATTTTDSAVIGGINWAIANKGVYDIRVINMSLSRGVGGVGGCDVYYTPGLNARAAGILPIAAAGNEALADQIGCPADNSQIVGVGGVYDANVGSRTYPGLCADATTRADQVTCFSNSWWTMALWAPGAVIDAAGLSGSGTSQATAMSSGVAAVLSNLIPSPAVYNGTPPSSWASEMARRLAKSTVILTDLRNNLSFPRLNLSDAIHPYGDDFGTPNYLLGVGFAGQSYNNINAAKESAEPNHAGNTGGHSLWFRFPDSSERGDVGVDTHGSSIDTLLAVYTGDAVNALTPVAANDDDGSPNGNSSLVFNFQLGKSYYVAVDGKNGASGLVFANTRFTPPGNDDFVNAETLSSSNGSISPSSAPANIRMATTEPGEPLHAGQAGTGSVWFQWTAPQTGQVIMDTAGSGFDTLLGVYQGTDVTALSEVVSDDDDGGAPGTSQAVFRAGAGQTYAIAVDAKQNGAAANNGVITLSWSTNPNARSDLAVTSVTTSPDPPWFGGTVQYTAQIANNGPDYAVGMTTAFTFDSNAYAVNPALPANCDVSGNVVTCRSADALAAGAVRSFRVIFDVKTTAPRLTTLSVSTRADTPDSQTGDNTATTNQPILDSPPVDRVDNDIPTLPQWGAILFAALLLLTGINRVGVKPRLCA